jgi:putative flippase GtrA
MSQTSKSKNTLAGERRTILKTTNTGNATSLAAKRLPASRETRLQLLRFIVIGVTCVVVDLVVYRLLCSQGGIRLDWAKAISYWAGVVVGFAGNKFWTFRSAQKSLREPVAYFILYSLTMLANIGCNRAVLATLVAEATGLAFLFATGVSTCLNFVGMRLLVFRRGIQQRTAEAASDSSPATLKFEKPSRGKVA